MRSLQPHPLLDLTRAARALLVAWLMLGNGCAVMREVPRSELAARPERRHLRVTDTAGRSVRLRWARFDEDSLRGSLGGGAGEPEAAFALRLDQVGSLEERQWDWFRTGLVAGVAIAGGLVLLLGKDDPAAPGEPGKTPVP